LGELDRVILPRLTELLKRLLTYPRQIDIRRHASYIQVAVDVICAGVLSDGLKGAKFSRIYRDEKLQKETERFSDFIELQDSKTTSNDTYMRAQARKALQEEVAELKKECESLRRDRNSKREDVDLQNMKTLENQRAQELRKITELEKRQVLDRQLIAKLKDEREKVSVIELL
jgi:hypothetical protein